MRGTNLSRSEQGQMLLATGVVLMMALLSMAVYGVRTAGISTPYDPGEDAAVETAGEVLDLFGPVLEARALGWVNAGYEPAESIDYALESLRDPSAPSRGGARCGDHAHRCGSQPQRCRRRTLDGDRRIRPLRPVLDDRGADPRHDRSGALTDAEGVSLMWDSGRIPAGGAEHIEP